MFCVVLPHRLFLIEKPTDTCLRTPRFIPGLCPVDDYRLIPRRGVCPYSSPVVLLLFSQVVPATKTHASTLRWHTSTTLSLEMTDPRFHGVIPLSPVAL